jgi:hypothetical protein
MKAQKIRILLVVALLSVMMVAGNVLPAAKTPVKLGCTFQENSYPLGTVLHYVLPYPQPVDVYMRCEWGLEPWPGGMTPRWVYYGSNPS